MYFQSRHAGAFACPAWHAILNIKSENIVSHAFWSACLVRLESELPPQQFNTWIRTLEIGESEAGGICLLAPNRFVLQWVRERYQQRLEQLAEEFFGAVTPLSFQLGSPKKPAAPRAASPASAPVVSATSTAAATASNKGKPATSEAPAVISSSNANGSTYEKTRLNPSFTFDTLVTGRANDLARAAAISVANNPGGTYNPLFVYGGVGLGKTHLIHAIGNEVLRHNPKAVVRYVHVEDYFSDVLRAYQQKNFDAFQRYYRGLDLLLIDDIQFLGVGNKERTRDEFFYAFNALTEAKKQIVITCDTYPKDIQGLEDRLISRFDWGLTVQIEPPELEMRIAILKKKAALDNVPLPDDVAFLIAKNLRSNVRELEGALKKVVAYARFNSREISLELAREALRDLLAAHNRQITIELIQKTVADFFKLKLAELLSKKRTRNIARPRQIAMYLARELTPASLPMIGEAFGGRDHTTVLHACGTIAELRLNDQQLNHDLYVLTQTLKG
ncbi:MAG: chromosomal replication initiation protein DnaA [Candidatus Dactylopiibacterium carminicum]|uniref:Chromosomal replication initiator protein DnaA n=1 Tax=Candidatus Dactylopiibacterium carminicum TaxID=857335 RepID=A0A272ES20_9RHOO|nr:chromosomal replication initiator protein DnaA [Candidatus Dactylopiibacterium carminicum]PAS92911.1 MAG: chromosomal replication initiation protein DnaA [Candidatus Dactylopiibacterium carminicum]